MVRLAGGPRSFPFLITGPVGRAAIGSIAASLRPPGHDACGSCGEKGPGVQMRPRVVGCTRCRNRGATLCKVFFPTVFVGHGSTDRWRRACHEVEWAGAQESLATVQACEETLSGRPVASWRCFGTSAGEDPACWKAFFQRFIIWSD